ncbi:vesicular glutamate transporter 2-like [Sipha flava]|uniref:Vesicular glutamate transporter 2-like n=1 Tax=Sipha flava TaxID=143950 RepID=A0A8B8GAX8_9HEMI|nr:vesicular glutamate transporter 2-like [Sipha flava]XP_025419918.1 vesicular glutamate transporter 2-like [Sipha flava]XP_025419919.1 vesicular glutamate transporter 2-like [Sipha flava]XP_025419920.1 vesicular glutamate transporter 2-like [Sipha flava]XP_025419921.1 vesicular glutamate transporter 2-like [Sipha flava]XP_025419922.1 vesicular glutamate transporter 2-like [Sipha flava]
MDGYTDQTFKSSSFPTESLSPPGQSVSRFRDECVRIKMKYFNREYAKIFVAFIGVMLVNMMQNNFWQQIVENEFGSHHRFLLAFTAGIFSVLSGVLSCIYPAQNVLGISIFLTSVVYMVNLLCKGWLDQHFFMHLLRNMMFVTALPPFHGIWASLIQLHKSSVLHVPIVLFSIYQINSDFPIGIISFLGYSYTLGTVSFVWCAVWVYMIFRPNIVPSYTMINSCTAPTLSDIPWKSMFTSMPVVAILIAVICEAFNLAFPYIWTLISSEPETFFRFSSYRMMNTFIIFVTMIFTIIVLEFYPKIRSTSTINIRKFWSCAYFLMQAIFYYVCAFTKETWIDDLFFIVYDMVEVLYAFGFIVNHLDIAPRYASILCGVITAVYYIFDGCVTNFFIAVKDYLKDHNDFLVCILVVIILVNITAVIFYFIFASAEVQPWAKTHDEETQQESDDVAVLVN